MKEINKGAEAIILLDNRKIIKKRISKTYRDPLLDKKIIKKRNKQESTLLKRAKIANVNTPIVYSVTENTIVMEKLEDTNQHEKHLGEIGREIAKLHDSGIIHGDLNLINIIITKEKKIYFIDFGLGFLSNKIEDKATDLLVFKKTLKAAKKTEKFWEKILAGYQKHTKNKATTQKIAEIEKRARYL